LADPKSCEAAGPSGLACPLLGGYDLDLELFDFHDRQRGAANWGGIELGGIAPMRSEDNWDGKNLKFLILLRLVGGKSARLEVGMREEKVKRNCQERM